MSAVAWILNGGVISPSHTLQLELEIQYMRRVCMFSPPFVYRSEHKYFKEIRAVYRIILRLPLQGFHASSPHLPESIYINMPLDRALSFIIPNLQYH
jgi:hypothetical protein